MIDEDTEPIHTWFSLTYANYLVLDPASTDGLDPSWHLEMAGMLGQLQSAFAHVRQPARYQARRGQEWEYGDLSDEQMAELGITTNADTVHEGCEHTPEPDLDDTLESYDARNAWDDELWECERDNLRWYDRSGDEWERDRTLTVPMQSVAEALARPCIVVPRAFLQSMPTAWQARFVELLNQINDDAVADSYKVLAFDDTDREIKDPVPHYNRGRTYIEPRLETPA